VGRFEAGPTGAYGKCFADTVEGATTWGNSLYGKFRIVEADVPDNAESLHKWKKLDNVGPARYLDVRDLENVKPRLVE
jgi:hypothetical protein